MTAPIGSETEKPLGFDPVDALSALPFAVLAVDRDSRIAFINNAAEQFFEYPNAMQEAFDILEAQRQQRDQESGDAQAMDTGDMVQMWQDVSNAEQRGDQGDDACKE